MAKIYDHAVIYNGVLYPADTPIEVKAEKTVVKEETTETPKTASKKGGAKKNDSTAD